MATTLTLDGMLKVFKEEMKKCDDKMDVAIRRTAKLCSENENYISALVHDHLAGQYKRTRRKKAERKHLFNKRIAYGGLCKLIPSK